MAKNMQPDGVINMNRQPTLCEWIQAIAEDNASDDEEHVKYENVLEQPNVYQLTREVLTMEKQKKREAVFKTQLSYRCSCHSYQLAVWAQGEQLAKRQMLLEQLAAVDGELKAEYRKLKTLDMVRCAAKSQVERAHHELSQIDNLITF
jgi:cell division protein FtsB